jgi:hypothetical protein
MLSRPAQRRGNIQHWRRRPAYPLLARRRVRKAVQPVPRPKLQGPSKRQDLLDSRFGQHLSILLHVIALTSFSIVGGCAWDFLLMTGFKRGMLMGVMTYGTFLLVSVALETKVQTKVLKHSDKK